jgi:hypothetical protein
MTKNMDKKKKWIYAEANQLVDNPEPWNLRD